MTADPAPADTAPSDTVVVSAPGKSILIGEHAAVYGRPALIAAIDRRLRVELESADGPAGSGPTGVHLALDLLGVDEHVSWEALEAYARDRRERWRRFHAAGSASAGGGPSGGGFDDVRGDDPAHVVKMALGVASLAAPRADSEDGRPRESVRLRVESALPVGAGFGSSAAAAVAVIRAVLALRGHDPSADTLHRLALDVERCQHGAPSGVDDSTVIHGGVLWAERDEQGGLQVERLRVDGRDVGDSPVLERFRVVDTGRPLEETGAVVAAVRALRDRDPSSFEARLDTMADATRSLRRQTEAATPDPAKVLGAIQRFESCLEALGVVPEPVRSLVRRIEAAGGAAKISGAGALGGSGAGSLLVYHPEAGALERAGVLDDVEILDLRFGADGVRVEGRPIAR